MKALAMSQKRMLIKIRLSLMTLHQTVLYHRVHFKKVLLLIYRNLWMREIRSFTEKKLSLGLQDWQRSLAKSKQWLSLRMDGGNINESKDWKNWKESFWMNGQVSKLEEAEIKEWRLRKLHESLIIFLLKETFIKF